MRAVVSGYSLVLHGTPISGNPCHSELGKGVLKEVRDGGSEAAAGVADCRAAALLTSMSVIPQLTTTVAIQTVPWSLLVSMQALWRG
jgi:hypothetical protein